MNLTDNEIIKALECLHQRILHSKFAEDVTEKEIMALVEVVDLINRQKAEIERLTNKLEQREEMMANLGVELTTMRGAANSYKMHYEKAQAEIEKYDNIKTTIHKFWDILLKLSLAKRKEKPTLEELAEAITEIEAEAIKEAFKRVKELPSVTNCEYEWLHLEIDNLIKEMVGE